MLVHPCEGWATAFQPQAPSPVGNCSPGTDMCNLRKDPAYRLSNRNPCPRTVTMYA